MPVCDISAAHCADCGCTDLHEGPKDPPPWCCCMNCGSCDVVELGDSCTGAHPVATADAAWLN